MRISRERAVYAATAGLLALNTLAGGASKARAQERPEPGVSVRQDCLTPGNYGIATVTVDSPHIYRTGVTFMVSESGRFDFSAGQAINPVVFDLNARKIEPGIKAPQVSIHRTDRLPENPTEQQFRESLVMETMPLGECRVNGDILMPVNLGARDQVVYPAAREQAILTSPNAPEDQTVLTSSNSDLAPGGFLMGCEVDGSTRVDYRPASTDKPLVVGGYLIDQQGVKAGSEKGYSPEQLATGEPVNVYIGNAKDAQAIRAIILEGNIGEVSSHDSLVNLQKPPVAVMDLPTCK